MGRRPLPLDPPVPGKPRTRHGKPTKQKGHGNGKPAGKKPYTTDQVLRNAVFILRAHGTQEDTICSALGIAKSTLKKYYQSELNAGLPELKAKLQATAVGLALSGDGPTLRWWLGLFGGPEWKRQNQFEIPGITKDGSTTTGNVINIRISADDDAL